MSIIKNKPAFQKALKNEPLRLRKYFSNLLYNVSYTLHYNITHLTPVWSGETLSNYRWSTGAPDTTVVLGILQPSEATNHLAVGAEAKRPAAQAIADESWRRMKFDNPYQVFFMTNNDPTVVGLEYGEYPEPPFIQRSPNGMFGISLNYVMERLRGTGGF